MSDARLPLPYRDSCAHLLIPLNRCRFNEYYLPWKCEVGRDRRGPRWALPVADLGTRPRDIVTRSVSTRNSRSEWPRWMKSARLREERGVIEQRQSTKSSSARSICTYYSSRRLHIGLLNPPVPVQHPCPAACGWILLSVLFLFVFFPQDEVTTRTWWWAPASMITAACCPDSSSSTSRLEGVRAGPHTIGNRY